MLLSTGIQGLDKLLGGGIPRKYVVGVIGGYGTGKTTLSLHFIHEGVKNGERCVFISFEEDEESILETAESFGMNLRKENVKIIRLEAEMVKESFEKIENEIRRIFESFGVERVVIDNVSVLETLYSDRERYRALSTFKKIVKDVGATAIITSECDKTNPLHSKYGILEYVSDGLIVLRMTRSAEFEEVILIVEVLKMRRMNHSRRPRPYAISERGMEVFEEAEIV